MQWREREAAAATGRQLLGQLEDLYEEPSCSIGIDRADGRRSAQLTARSPDDAAERSCARFSSSAQVGVQDRAGHAHSTRE